MSREGAAPKGFILSSTFPLRVDAEQGFGGESGGPWPDFWMETPLVAKLSGNGRLTPRLKAGVPLTQRD